MKKTLSILALISLAVLLNFVFASPVESIKPIDAQKMQLEQKAIIVDVRELDEQKDGMAKDAISAPMSTMNDKKEEWEKILATFPKDKAVVVYCRSGRRSGKVGEELLKKGFKVLNMGGFESWEKAGLPVEKK